MLNQNFVFLGVFLMLVGGLSYFIDTIKGKVQPNKVSYLLWSLAPLIAFIAEVKQGVGLISWATFIVGFVPFFIFLVSFINKKAFWKIGRFDLACGSLSILGLVMWYITKVGNTAILFSILADGLASVPTIAKSYYHPETESDWVYLCTAINAGFALLTIKIWDFQNYGFPLYLFIVFTFVFLLIRFKLGKRINSFLKIK